MNITETRSEGLSREFQIVLTAQDIDERLTGKLEEMKGQIHLKGFRPGKAPVSYLKKAYGKSMRSEIIQDMINETNSKTLEERELRPAQSPKVDFDGEIQEVIEKGGDVSYKMEVELIPDFEPVDFATIKIERPVAEVTDEEVQRALEGLAEQQKTYPEKDGAAESGDQVKINFVGRIDGEEFEGGKADDMPLVLGSGQFIPGFEDQLIGAKAGEDRLVKVTFPENYGAENLKGKDAEFDVHVNEVGSPQLPPINDELATGMGLEGLDKVKEIIKERIGEDYAQMSREKMKRALLDALDEAHDFELPPGMVEAEFNQIWHQVTHSMEHSGATFEDEGTTEDAAKEDYRKIAERRVRLGLLLGEVGRKNKIEVTQEEIGKAIGERARQFPGQEQQVFNFYTSNPEALNEIRAPLYEDKVIDFVAELAEITDVAVSREELFKNPDEDEHDHDHDHDHDHGHDEKPKKKTKKAAAKKDD